MKSMARKGGDAEDAASTPASQTLLRGLDILEAVAGGAADLGALSAALGTSRSTTHRLAAALVERRFLGFVPREGYVLGPKLLELGFRAQRAMPVPRVARPFLERLAASCEDTVHLGVLDGDRALYLDKIPGRRPIEISSRVGERHPVWSTGVGKALILDLGAARWRDFYDRGTADLAPAGRPDAAAWLAGMSAYAQGGVAFDLEENEPQVRCVAAPVRDATGATVAALSVSGTLLYMDRARMARLADEVRDTAEAVSRALGWPGAGWPGAGWPGAGWPGAGWPGAGWPGTGWPGAG